MDNAAATTVPTRLRSLRTRINATQREAAAMFRVGRRTYQEWESGEAKISGPATLALDRWEADEGEAMERLDVVRRTGGEDGGAW